MSDSKSPQVSRTRLSILAVLSNAVVWIVSTCPVTSKSSRPFNNPLVTVPNAPITIGTIVTFMFHSFFNSLARSRYLSFFSLSFRFILWSAGTAKSTILQILFLLLIIMRSGLLAGIRWSVCMIFWEFSHRCYLIVFYWSLSDNESPQVSRTLLSTLADLKNAVVWMMSNRPLISKSSSPGTNPSMIISNRPNTISITITFMFLCFYYYYH